MTTSWAGLQKILVRLRSSVTTTSGYRSIWCRVLSGGRVGDSDWRGDKMTLILAWRHAAVLEQSLKSSDVWSRSDMSGILGGPEQLEAVKA